MQLELEASSFEVLLVSSPRQQSLSSVTVLILNGGAYI